MAQQLIKGIHHLGLKCKGIEKFKETVHFYKDILGLKVYKEFEFEGYPVVMLTTGSGCVEVFADAKEEMPTGIVQHFGLFTDDPDACVKAVREAGYKITVEPVDLVLPDKKAPFPIRFAFCEGPAGETVEFFCER